MSLNGMKKQINRRTIDLSGYPDLVVIYLGMRVNQFRGLRTLLSFGAKIRKAVDAQPDGLLLHENLIFSLFPLHMGMRQYWRNFESLERWARSLPHQAWWQEFVRDSGGTGFWHETYFMRGGMEAIYDDVVAPIGFMCFAPLQPARGGMFTARGRLKLGGRAEVGVPVTEEELYKESKPLWDQIREK
jgi:hypothetical protein